MDKYKASIRGLLAYSWSPISYNYDLLTPTEKQCITREDFEGLKTDLQLEDFDKEQRKKLSDRQTHTS